MTLTRTAKQTSSPDETTTTMTTIDRRAQRNWAGMFSPTRIGALYVLVIITIVFSIWLPQTFPHIETLKQIGCPRNPGCCHQNHTCENFQRLTLCKDGALWLFGQK